MTSQTQDLIITNTASIPPSNVINFGYVKKEDVKVEVGTTVSNRTLISASDWTITSDRRVQLPSSLFSATGTYKLKIYRQTDTSALAHTFQVGSSIKAEDLNNSNKQAIFAAEENTNSINSLAAGDASGSIQIDGSNIADDSISSDKIINLQVKSVDLSSHISDDSLRAVTTNHIRDNAVTTAKIADDNVTANKLKSSSSTDSDRAVTTNHIRDGAVTDAKINSVSGSKVTPNFGSQNISTTGTLNAGTTTTGATTASSIAVTNEIVLSEGTTTDKGLRFPPNIGGGTGDTAYIRHYVDGGGENTRLHIANENDADDDIYLQTGLVHTNGNLSVAGTITGGSFSGNGSGLTGIATNNLNQIQEAASTGASNTNSNSYSDKVTLSVNTASNTRVMVFFGFEMRHSNTNNYRVYAKFTGSNYNPVGGEQEFSQNSSSYITYSGQALDIGSHSGTRTYRIQYKRNSNTGYIQNAYLCAIAFNV